MLDAVRGIAAQAVVIGHASSAVLGESPLNTVLGWASYTAVLVFFVLSGYVICGSVLREYRVTGSVDTVDFAIRRIARIMPPYLATLALVGLFFTMTEIGREMSARYDLSLLGFVRSVFFGFTSHDAVVLTPVWSLRLEVVLYGMIALAAAAFAAEGNWRTVWCFALGLIVTFGMLRLAFMPTAIITFALGGLMAWARPNRSAALLSAGPMTSALAALGAFSYTLYLIHMPVILCVSSGLAGQNRVLIYFVAVLSSSAAAFLVARVVERPKTFADLIRRRLAVLRPQVS
ncbi:peptidoglycan/LPS O-acetylase OafA/YrhL [Afipia massiliensis]|uniref:Peptidoglycan/LPS O-acetylase OafA/YrhL n=1 Tax=Afipia massiliensis TaxID=211460 RepID=A0A840MTL7_9BRAD|nr:peptidoglycan/LPS O-acetylase OafA/YrhL [Afipia massiliensis]